MSPFKTARKSIAFNSAVADDLNRKASAFDPRLYCFAYYEPTALPEGADLYTVFHLAVLNMYSLLWDCGPKMQEKILNKQLYQALGINPCEMDKCQAFSSLVKAIRTDICHNNSCKFYFNALLKAEVGDYMANHSVVAENNPPQVDWGNLCKDFFKRCDCFVQDLERVIRLATSRHQTEIKDAWIAAIADCYKENEHFFLHVLADKYALKQRTYGRHGKISKAAVKRWINTVKVDDEYYYESYRQQCKARIAPLLTGKNCPKPALPLDFFHQITRDASNF